MIGVAIAYITMGSLYFLSKKLNLNRSYLSQSIYLSLFIAGCFLFVISIIDFIFPSYIWKVISGISICIMCLNTLRIVRNWMRADEVMNKLDK